MTPRELIEADECIDERVPIKVRTLKGTEVTLHMRRLMYHELTAIATREKAVGEDLRSAVLPAWCLCDEDGIGLWDADSDDDLHALQRGLGCGLGHVIDECLRISGFGRREETLGNSEAPTET